MLAAVVNNALATTITTSIITIRMLALLLCSATETVWLIQLAALVACLTVCASAGVGVYAKQPTLGREVDSYTEACIFTICILYTIRGIFNKWHLQLI